jgi:hypothetical protein
MNNKEFIKGLAKENKKVKKPYEPLSNFYKWIILSLFSVVGGISSLGLRGDWVNLFSHPSLLFQNIVLLCGFLWTGYASFKLTRPGDFTRKKAILFLIIPFVLWAVALLLISSIGGSPSFSFGCIKDILIIGVVPGLVLLFFLFQGVVLNRFVTGLVSSAALLGVGAWGVQFTCHNDNPIHVLVSHFLPMIVCAAIGAGVFMKLHKKV